MLLTIPLLFLFLMTIYAIINGIKNTYEDFNVPGITSVLGFIVLGIMFLYTITTYTDAKSELRVIDEKIQIITSNNKERVNSILPVLEKYPEIEKSIIGGINPNNFAVIGSVYPVLKSNEVYQQQAKLIKDNIDQLQKLQVQKLDKQKSIYESQMYLWFLK